MNPAWTKFEPATLKTTVDPFLLKIREAAGIDNDEIFLNSRYQVNIRRNIPQSKHWPKMIHLSIKRLDKQPIHDWREMQRIKNELIGPEHEALEIYPAESRLVDTSNQFHIWCFAEKHITLPFGFNDRWVSNDGCAGSVQRKFPPDNTPSDCRTLEQYIKDSQIKKP